MQKVRRAVLYFLGAILALLVVALLAVNLYVQARGTQARIETELSRRLGTTLRIDRISVTPWWGLKLRGITIPQSDGTVRADFLKADTFRLRIRFLSLFARELIIKEISLVNPTVVWAQNSDGKWRIPSSLPPEEPDRPGATATAPEMSVPPAPLAQTQASPLAPSGAASGSSFKPEVRRVNLTNGNFQFLDARQRPVATFAGFGFRSNVRNSSELRGNASVAKISLRKRFFLERLKSPVRYDATDLEFSEIKAAAGGGEITGRFSMQQAEPGSPFEATVNFRDVQADRVVTEAGGPAGMVQGRIEGTLQANGKTADPNALAGVGEIYLREGQLRGYTLLVALGQLLQIDELAQLRFDQAHVKYHINPGVVTIDELLLSSANIRVAARGNVGFDGKLRLDSQLVINERIRGQLFRGMRESFRPTDDAGYSAVDFKVSGTVVRPKTDLMGKLVGRDLKDLGGIISGLLGGGKEKKKQAASTEAAPEATASQEDAAAAEPQPSGTP